mmetsp:Transcript_32712/g.45629  ORF Transcript_32712/g.45629 Transcript_32712/m.45629 type:complete len:148 (-) Transcript_32712:127-570(-)
MRESFAQCFTGQVEVCSFLAQCMDIEDYTLETKKGKSRSYSMPGPHAGEPLLPVRSSRHQTSPQGMENTKNTCSDFKMKKHDVKNKSLDAIKEEQQTQIDRTSSIKNCRLREEINTLRAKLEVRNNVILALVGLLLSMSIAIVLEMI